MRRFPPNDRSQPWIELRREVGLEDIEITVISGDTYDLSLAETRFYFRQLGVPELKGEKALDKLWNFYAIRLHLDPAEDYRHETLTPPQYPEVAGYRPLEDVAWVIESDRIK